MSVSADQATAVILAGGLGTRIRHLLPDLPKPMAPVNGRPFVEWLVRYLARAGVRRAVISTGYKADVIARHFQSQPVPGISVGCVAEPSPLGTAGGFLNAIAHESPAPCWLVLNGDSMAAANLSSLFALLDNPAVSGAILGVEMADAARYGTVLHDEKNWLTGFREKQPGAGLINAGVYLFRAQTLARFPHQSPLSFEKDVFPALARQQVRLKVLAAQAPFLDIGTPETLPQADAFLKSQTGVFTPL